MRFIIGLFFLTSFYSYGQSDTEVYVFDLELDQDSYQLTNQRNVSNNPGYDNQPSFFNDNQLLFASTRNGQTDIASYNLRDAQTNWISDTPNGSEYSPTKIPAAMAVSAIRLDSDGLQRLYRYDFKTGTSTLLLKDLVVGYHLWFNDHIILSAVLADGGLDLVRSDLTDGSHVTLQKKIGRSLHKIPNTNLISYVSKETDTWQIKSLDPISGATDVITTISKDSEDYCWLLNGTIVMGYRNALLQFNPKKDSSWSAFKTFNDGVIWNISRVATNSINTQFALVSEIAPDAIVQKHIEAFNKKDRAAYFDCFSDDVKVIDYPNTLRYQGIAALKKDYNQFFDTYDEMKVEVLTKMTSGNKVVYEEATTIDGKQRRQATIFEVANGKITSMTFIYR